MSGQIVLLRSCILTLVTCIPYSFLFGPLVHGQTILMCSFIFALVTAIPRSYMYCVLMSCQTTLFISFIVTLMTTVSFSHMYDLSAQMQSMCPGEKFPYGWKTVSSFGALSTGSIAPIFFLLLKLYFIIRKDK